MRSTPKFSHSRLRFNIIVCQQIFHSPNPVCAYFHFKMSYFSLSLNIIKNPHPPASVKICNQVERGDKQ